MKWTKFDGYLSSSIGFPAADYSSFRDMAAVSVFESIFTDEIFTLMMDKMLKYALFLNCPDPHVSKDELKVFLGILIVSGYNILAGKRQYWEAASDVRNEMVYNAMRRDRFAQLMRFLHFADNTKPDLMDKMWKLRPLVNILKSSFLKNFRPTQQLAYDESMVAYFGRHGCKQFIREKPIRFGYKVWSLNNPNGYLVNFEIYQGRNPYGNSEYEEKFGKAAAPLVQMIDDIPEPYKHLSYHFYFDNLFTGMMLLAELKDRGYAATGTIRDNRVPKGCSLTSKKAMAKQKRGSHESLLCDDEGIVLTHWVDNSVVTVASTGHGVLPVSNVQRYSQTERKIVMVPRPLVVGEYNKYMGGTDRMDENISMYRVGIRGKKMVVAIVHMVTGCFCPQCVDYRQICWMRSHADFDDRSLRLTYYNTRFL